MQEMLGVNIFQLYADNTVIYCSDKSIDLVEIRLQNLINKFSKWCKQNVLTINTQKKVNSWYLEREIKSIKLTILKF